MIVIMGATGQVGGATLKALTAAGQQVRGISRTPRADDEGTVEWVVADATDTKSLAAAFRGAEAAFLLNVVPLDANDVYEEADRLSSSIAAAVAAASVPHVVALSSQGAHLTEGTGIVATLGGFERALRATSASVTFLRAAYFMENWIPLAQAASQTGKLPAFLGPETAIDAVSVTDIGQVAARSLLDPEPGVVNVVGPTRYSENDAAAILSQLTGRSVQVDTIPADAVVAAHMDAGLGASYAAGMAGLYEALNGAGIPFEDGVGGIEAGTTTLRDVLAGAVRSTR